jgi:hypothetical protein
MLPRGAASGTPRPTRLLPEWPVPKEAWISRLDPLDFSNPLMPFLFACYHLCWSRVKGSARGSHFGVACETYVRGLAPGWVQLAACVNQRPYAAWSPRLVAPAAPPCFPSVLSRRTALSCSGGLLTRTAEIRHQTAQPTRGGCLLGRRVRPRQLLSNSALPLAEP